MLRHLDCRTRRPDLRTPWRLGCPNRHPPHRSSFSPARGARRLAAGDAAAISASASVVSNTEQPLFQERVGGTTYFYSAEDRTPATTSEPSTVVVPLSACTTPLPQLPPVAPPAPVLTPTKNGPCPAATAVRASFFVSDEIREQVLKRQSLMLVQPNPAAFRELPTEVESYHELCPLETPGHPPQKSSTFGVFTSCYKATNMKTGQYCLLRRLHGVCMQDAKWLQAAAVWRKMSHPGLVTLRDAFATKAFGDTSLVVVYDYLPGAETMWSRHLSQPSQLSGFADPFQDPSIPRPYSALKTAVLRQKSALPAESLVWDYVVQLTGVLRQVHAAGLACRLIEPAKILVTGNDRLHVNCCGIPELMAAETTPNQSLTQHYQREDLVNLGKLLLVLSCNSVLAVQREHFNTAINIVEKHYSADLKTVIMSLLMSLSGGCQRSINDLMPVIGARFYTQLTTARHHSDRLEDELDKELQNGRLFRLMAKLSTITERSELNLDGAWSETGDRYMLKLFRDYVFHAVTDDGAPFLDMAHVVQSLNKMDAGSPDKVCLTCRDMPNVLVTSYAELKLCFERSFQEIFESYLQKEPPAT